MNKKTLITGFILYPIITFNLGAVAYLAGWDVNEWGVYAPALTEVTFNYFTNP